MANLIAKRLNQAVDLAWRSLSRFQGGFAAAEKGKPLLGEDPSLCDELLRDLSEAETAFRPTNYWRVYQDRLMPVMREQGLLKFRASRLKIYSSFGVSQIPSALANLSPLMLDGREMTTHPSDVINQFMRTYQAFCDMCFYSAVTAEPRLLGISDSGFGCPQDLFSPPGYPANRYTLSFLRYFHYYAWLNRSVDLSKVRSVLELGTGYGGQAEVFMKLHPGIRYILCDIPPQVYVAEQYLKSVFPGRVTGYRETKSMPSIDLSGPGGILVMTPWQLKKVAGQADLFLSTMTFQEMEPENVRMYARLIQPLVSQHIYLMQLSAGQHVAATEGAPGVLEPVTTRHYLEAFDRFPLLKKESASLFMTGQQGIPYCNFNGHEHFLFSRTPRT